METQPPVSTGSIPELGPDHVEISTNTVDIVNKEVSALPISEPCNLSQPTKGHESPERRGEHISSPIDKPGNRDYGGDGTSYSSYNPQSVPLPPSPPLRPSVALGLLEAALETLEQVKHTDNVDGKVRHSIPLPTLPPLLAVSNEVSCLPTTSTEVEHVSDTAYASTDDKQDAVAWESGDDYWPFRSLSSHLADGGVELMFDTRLSDDSDDDSDDDSSDGFSFTNFLRQAEEHEKTLLQEKKEAIDAALSEVKGLVGLPQVKDQFLRIKYEVELRQRQGVDLRDGLFNAVFLGKSGTGKRTACHYYARLLRALGVLESAHVVETSSSVLLKSDSTTDLIDSLVSDYDGGVFFVDDAHQLLAASDDIKGFQILESVRKSIDNHQGKVVVILAGHDKDIKHILSHIPELSARLPYTFKFEDLGVAELIEILHRNIERKYKGKMKIQGGIDGLFVRIAVSQLARGQGSRSFENAGSVKNLLRTIERRQGDRLRRIYDGHKRSDGLSKDHEKDEFLFTQEDIIGPNPSKVQAESKAWKKLQKLIGMSQIKESVRNLFRNLEINYQRQLREEKPLLFSLNRVFVGEPGTGKTTVAELYGQILRDLGLLSKGEIVFKNPSDFIGCYSGETEKFTRKILADSIGNVLIIDEAYALNPKNNEDKKAVLDMIVAEVQGVLGDNRCVLLLGYETEMKEMFRLGNKGLTRRFAFETPFRFENFNLSQLVDILKLKMNNQNLLATEEALKVATGMLDRTRMRPNFSNGGEVDMLLERAKESYQARQSSPEEGGFSDDLLHPEDFDAYYMNKRSSHTTSRELLKDRLAASIIDDVERLEQIGVMARLLGKNPRDEVPVNFLLIGPPGTGRSTLAQHLANMYYNMGFLSSTEVIESSETDFASEYIGGTGHRTTEQVERALGKVLLVDDAHRLAPPQHNGVDFSYGGQVIEQLLYLLKMPRYSRKMVTILAGDTEGMSELLRRRPELASVFSRQIVFENLAPKDSLILLSRILAEKDIQAPFLADENSPEYGKLSRAVRYLSTGPLWGNSRDVETLAEDMRHAVYSAFFKEHPESIPPGTIITLPALTGDQAEKCANSMLDRHRKILLTRNGNRLPPRE